MLYPIVSRYYCKPALGYAGAAARQVPYFWIYSTFLPCSQAYPPPAAGARFKFARRHFIASAYLERARRYFVAIALCCRACSNSPRALQRRRPYQCAKQAFKTRFVAIDADMSLGAQARTYSNLICREILIVRAVLSRASASAI